MVAILAPGFHRLSKKLDGAARTHARYLAYRWLIFAFAAVIDALIPPALFHLIVIGRVLIVTGYVLIFTGFAPPKEK